MGCCMHKKSKNNLSQVQKFAKLNIHQFYRFGRILGSGSFGTVKIAYSLVQERNGESKKYAIKSVDKLRVGAKLYLIQRELEILAALDHPNIIRVYEEYEDQRYFHFVMEYCSGGELFERVLNNGPYNEHKAQQVMKQLFSAVQYIHEQGITHRDLKPENLILTSPETDIDIRIIDFGLSKLNQASAQNERLRKQIRQQSKVGTPIYVAPEVLSGQYCELVDEWSLGCIMHVLLVGEPPFNSQDIYSLENKIKNSDVNLDRKCWDKISKEAKDLIGQLLEKNPKKRVSCKQALQSHWIKKYESSQSIEKPLVRLNTIQSQQQQTERTLNLLKNYANISKLKKETLKILLNQLNEQQIKTLREKFEEFDTDNSGTISVLEIANIMKQMGFKESEKEITAMLKKFMVGKLKYEINYTEFMTALLNCSTYLNEERLWSLFKQFDTNNQNFITREDIIRTMERRGMPSKKIATLLSEFECSQLESLNFEDFCKFMLEEEDFVSMKKSSRHLRVYKYMKQPTGDYNYFD